MSKKSSVIEINGKRYDAITGKLIGAVKRVAVPAALSLDGFSRTKNRLAEARNRTKHPAGQVHKRTQKGKTLMRTAVQRPATTKAFQKIISSKALAAASPGRLARASAIHKSAKISKYARLAKKTAVQATRVSEGKVVSPQVMQDQSGGLALSKPLPSMVTSVSHQHLERLLDEALAKADAHKQMLKQLQKRSWWHKIGLPKWLGISIVTAVAISAAGLFAWQKVPQVSLKLAASKAKISASVPTYKPEGFSVSGPVKYESGAVVMTYSGSGNQAYTISQKASDWDSVSLAANAIPANSPVQTSQIKGTTVYIYGSGNNASWVSNGIRYTLKNKANLSSDQIIKIADSL